MEALNAGSRSRGRKRGDHGLVYKRNERTGGGPQSFFGPTERKLQRLMGPFATQLIQGKLDPIRDEKKEDDSAVWRELVLNDVLPAQDDGSESEAMKSLYGNVEEDEYLNASLHRTLQQADKIGKGSVQTTSYASPPGRRRSSKPPGEEREAAARLETTRRRSTRRGCMSCNAT